MVQRSQTQSIIDPEFLLVAYVKGFFPMADSRSGEVGWYSPDPRAIIDLERFHIPRSLRQTIKKNIVEVYLNRRFEDVIRSCADRDETWISEQIVQSYCELHRRGFAHSVETWRAGKLVGGLYGVALRSAFFGESMFSAERNASSVALAFLVRRLVERGFTLLDTQWMTPHLARFGAREIPKEEYLERLQYALTLDVSFT